MAQERKQSKLGSLLFGPAMVFVAVLALWENEGRFNFYQAARKAPVVESIEDANGVKTFAHTAALETEMPIEGLYVEAFSGYYRVHRNADIYCWERDEDSDGNVTWSKRWLSHVESNSRNTGLVQTLKSDVLYPHEFRLGSLTIAIDDIHLVDKRVDIPVRDLVMTDAGRQQQLSPAKGMFFKGQGTIGNPELGDERIAYSGIANAPTASYFGALTGEVARGKQFEINKSFISEMLQNDGVLHHLANGDREQALDTIKARFSKLKWITRGIATGLVVLGIYITISAFVGLLYGIPWIGNLLSWGAFLFSLLLGLALSLLVMLISYALHNPIVVLLPVALVIAGVYYLRRRSRTTRDNVTRTLREYQQTHSAEPIDIDTQGWTSNFAEQTFAKLVAMASLNGLSSKEAKFLERWAELNGVAKDRIDQMIEHSREDADLMGIDTRNEMILLVCVALADGMLSTRELTALRGIAKRIGMPESDFREIVEGVESGELRPV